MSLNLPVSSLAPDSNRILVTLVAEDGLESGAREETGRFRDVKRCVEDCCLSYSVYLTGSRGWFGGSSGMPSAGEEDSVEEPWNTSKALWRGPVVSCCGGLAVMAQESISWDPGSIPGHDTSFDVPESSCLLSGPGPQPDSRYMYGLGSLTSRPQRCSLFKLCESCHHLAWGWPLSSHYRWCRRAFKETSAVHLRRPVRTPPFRRRGLRLREQAP